MKLADKASVMEQIKKLGENDLIFLNNLIVERLKLIDQAKSIHLMGRFNIGDRVAFRTSNGNKKIGIIVRLNIKTASIRTDDGGNWKVSPMFLMAESQG